MSGPGQGRDISGSTVSDIEKTKALCLLGKDIREQSDCAYGAALDFFAYYRLDSEVKLLCESLSSDLQQACFRAIDSYKDFFLR